MLERNRTIFKLGRHQGDAAVKCQKALISFVTLLLLGMPAVAQKPNDDFTCTTTVRCDPIGDSVRMVLGDTHTPVYVLPPGRWSSQWTADINTQRARQISSLAYAIVERGKITGITMSAAAFQTTILVFGKHERTEKKFGMEASIRSLCEVRGFLNGWEAAHTLIRRQSKKRQLQNYSKVFQCGA